MTEKTAAGARARPSRRVAVDTDELQRRCTARGWRQIDLARESGVHKATLSRAFTVGHASAPTLRLIAEALDCEITDLIAASKKTKARTR